MKAFSKSLSIVFILLFIAGIVAGAYFMYTLPDDLVTKTKVVDLREITEVYPLLNRVNIILGATVFAGLLAIVTLMTRGGNKDENIVYIETFADGKEKADATVEEAEDSHASDSNLMGIVRAALQEDSDGKAKAEKALSAIANELEASQGAVYLSRYGSDKRFIELFASYAFILPESATLTYEFGEGLAGQAAKENKAVNISAIPEGYVKILSGLGEATPSNLAIIPFHSGDKVAGVVEIASFRPFADKDVRDLEQAFGLLADAIGYDPQVPAATQPAASQEAEAFQTDEELVNE